MNPALDMRYLVLFLQALIKLQTEKGTEQFQKELPHYIAAYCQTLITGIYTSARPYRDFYGLYLQTIAGYISANYEIFTNSLENHEQGKSPSSHDGVNQAMQQLLAVTPHFLTLANTVVSGFILRLALEKENNALEAFLEEQIASYLTGPEINVLKGLSSPYPTPTEDALIIARAVLRDAYCDSTNDFFGCHAINYAKEEELNPPTHPEFWQCNPLPFLFELQKSARFYDLPKECIDTAIAQTPPRIQLALKQLQYNRFLRLAILCDPKVGNETKQYHADILSFALRSNNIAMRLSRFLCTEPTYSDLFMALQTNAKEEIKAVSPASEAKCCSIL